MTRAGERCAVLSQAVDEPLAGTAPHAPRWLCVEHRGAWPREVGTHAEPAVRTLAARATAAGWRPLLIRRPQRGAAGPLRVFLTDTVRCRTTTRTVDGPDALADLPLPVGGDLPGTPVPDPLLLVCTHGRRDRCCALDGRALVTALLAAGEPDVWECTHLGGHRFAPTALVLPTGYVYGRLDLPAAVAVRKSAGLGEVEPARSRGRSAWTPAGQVAELAVRIATGLREAGGLAVVPGDDGAADEEILVVADDGRRWAVTVRSGGQPADARPAGARPGDSGREPPPPGRAAARPSAPGTHLRPASCGAEPEPVRPLRATAVRALPSATGTAAGRPGGHLTSAGPPC
ncbi:MAG TPA: sucrase ferredoxin [Pseudonocardia sp.]|nr:sucrase ferredoxin [Pseudonocardia sp.]